MTKFSLQRYNILLLLLLNITLVQSQRRRRQQQQQGGRNIVISSNGLAIATTLGRVTRSSIVGGTSLVTFDVRTGIERTHSFDNVLPRGIQGFDDVAISESSATSSTGRNGRRRTKSSIKVFAIDANSGLLCSFNLRNVNSLSFIGCTTRSVASQPFVGIDTNNEGTLVVSGGTGGASVFSYNTNTGVLDNTPSIRNRELGDDIGYPSVTFVNSDEVAFGTDADRGFAVTIATIGGSRRRPTLSRDAQFRVRDTIGFDYVLQPANFPFDSAVYIPQGRNNNIRWLYVANGAITVQNPNGNVRSSRDVSNVIPNRFDFEAVTISIDSSRSIAVVGGLTNGGSSSAYVVLDVSRPQNPRFVALNDIGRNNNSSGGRGSGRITSIATADGIVLYVKEGSSSIGRDNVSSLLEEEGEEDEGEIDIATY